MKRTAVSFLCWSGLVLFTLYLLRVNQFYYHANTHVPTYDEAWYLETSLRLYHRLAGGGLGEFLEAYRGSFGSKAPLISVLPAPFYLVFGVSHVSALMVNSLWIVIANLYLFLLVRRLFSAEAGLAAVAFYQTMPLVYGLSRVVMAEYGLAALVLVWLYYLVASEGLRRGRANFALGVVLGLGLLMKVLFPAFIAGPLLVTWLWRRQEKAPLPDEGFWLWRLCARRPLVAIAAPALAIAATWYAHHWKTLLEFAWQSAFGEVAVEYGAGGLGRWMLALINEGISSYYALALILLGSVALIGSHRRVAWHQLARDERTLLLLSWLIPPLVVLAAGRNHLLRFVIPLLPVFAIVLAVSIFQLGRRNLAPALLAFLLVIYPQRLYAAMSYFYHGHEQHPVRWGPFILFSRDLGWAHPPVWESGRERRGLLEALRRLVSDAVRPEYAVVAVEHVYLNANLLNYLNAYQEYPLVFTSLGYAESSAERGIERIYSLDARFVILGEGFLQLPGFLNRVNREVAARIAQGEMPYRLRARVPLAHQMKALIYERESPWARSQAGSEPPRPAHPLAVDFPGGIRFLGYDWKKKDRFLWELSYYWTVLDRVAEDFLINVEFRRGDSVVARQDYFIGDGRFPFPEWQPGEVVRQTRTVYLGPQSGGGPVEVQLWLTAWGFGPPRGERLPARRAASFQAGGMMAGR
ncbi:MAG: glycosyltransferase family 39 protein [Acidobacteria bacterium]|nr:glycosyltransferase family 39 protein [Acidobacteriota bacterium]